MSSEETNEFELSNEPSYGALFIQTIETWWYTNHRWPTSNDLAQILGKSIEWIENEFELRLPYLKRRGIDRMLKQGEMVPNLDPIRWNVAMAVSNIHDPKRLGAKLKELSIPETQYRGWLQDPAFSSLIAKRSDDLIHEELPEISKTLTRKASQGDLRATKMLLELTGKLQQRQNQTINVFGERDSATFIVKQLVEVIKTHVKDPETLVAIANDFDKILKVGNFAAPFSLEAGSDEDLMAAKTVRGTIVDF